MIRVTLDENLPHKLRQCFEENIEFVTVGYRGWRGKENGELLSIAATEFDAFITMDGGILNQQNLDEINLGIVLLEAESNRFEKLAPLISQVNVALKTLENGQVVRANS